MFDLGLKLLFSDQLILHCIELRLQHLGYVLWNVVRCDLYGNSRIPELPTTYYLRVDPWGKPQMVMIKMRLTTYDLRGPRDKP